MNEHSFKILYVYGKVYNIILEYAVVTVLHHTYIYIY